MRVEKGLDEGTKVEGADEGLELVEGADESRGIGVYWGRTSILEVDE